MCAIGLKKLELLVNLKANQRLWFKVCLIMKVAEFPKLALKRGIFLTYLYNLNCIYILI